MILKFKEYEVESVPTETPFVRYWKFTHKIKKFELVCQYSNGKLSGSDDMKIFLRNHNLLTEEYIPKRQVIKKYYNDIDKAQTYHIGSKKLSEIVI